MNRLFYCFILMFFAALNVQAQQNPRSSSNVVKTGKTSANSNSALKSSAAYGEIIAALAEAKVDLKILLFDYKEAAPQVVAKRQLIESYQTEIGKLEAMPTTIAPKLTLALGRLLVKKIEAGAELNELTKEYAEEYPSVKKARIRLQVFTEETDKLLQ
ncbi:MAG: hypothetical protein H7Z37_16330 [Pyrinomonadaceae bacterium]|nr:hypothetical protein [Pyrinomonadaceae bacterium]